MSIMAQQTTTYHLQERNDVNGRITTLDTVTDRESGLARLDEQIREYPVRYRYWTAYRLVLVEAKDGDR